MEKRESTDVEVSRYYFSTGDFKAAYLRAKDAVSIYADDEAAHLALAQSAERLGKRDEAVTEYNAFLKLDPDGPKSKMVRKELAQLGSK